MGRFQNKYLRSVFASQDTDMKVSSLQQYRYVFTAPYRASASADKVNTPQILAAKPYCVYITNLLSNITAFCSVEIPKILFHRIYSTNVLLHTAQTVDTTRTIYSGNILNLTGVPNCVKSKFMVFKLQLHPLNALNEYKLYTRVITKRIMFQSEKGRQRKI